MKQLSHHIQISHVHVTTGAMTLMCGLVNEKVFASTVSINCGTLTLPTNGLVDTLSGTTFGSVATFSCNTGYRLSHQQVVVCGADGVWSPASPSCLGGCKVGILLSCRWV